MLQYSQGQYVIRRSSRTLLENKYEKKQEHRHGLSVSLIDDENWQFIKHQISLVEFCGKYFW